MLVPLIVVPLIVLATYEYSERATREWVGAGLDLDIELLALVSSDVFMLTHFGRQLIALRERLGSAVVVDMFCLLRLELELSLQARALLLAQGAGLALPPATTWSARSPNGAFYRTRSAPKGAPPWRRCT